MKWAFFFVQMNMAQRIYSVFVDYLVPLSGDCGPWFSFIRSIHSNNAKQVLVPKNVNRLELVVMFSIDGCVSIDLCSRYFCEWIRKNSLLLLVSFILSLSFKSEQECPLTWHIQCNGGYARTFAHVGIEVQIHRIKFMWSYFPCVAFCRTYVYLYIFLFYLRDYHFFILINKWGHDWFHCGFCVIETLFIYGMVHEFSLRCDGVVWTRSCRFYWTCYP